jgi:hypothetical protein
LEYAESFLRLNRDDGRLLTFLPYDFARFSGEPGLFTSFFLGANMPWLSAPTQITFLISLVLAIVAASPSRSSRNTPCGL